MKVNIILVKDMVEENTVIKMEINMKENILIIINTG
jgi:hypothetical protein